MPLTLTMRILKYIKIIPLWVYILLLGFITFYTYQIRISDDMQWYCKTAMNIYQGEGFVDTDGSPILVRPVFPYMIALAYWLLGPSHWNAFWVVRLFCILNPVMIYFLGKELFGKWVGFSAALLVLSSWALNMWSYRHLDAIWPFWVFLAIYLLVKRIPDHQKWPFFLAGICMGIGFLIKEVVMLFLVFPVLLLMGSQQYRNKKYLKKIIIFYSGFVIFVSPWVTYQLLNGGIRDVLYTAPTVASAIVSPQESSFLNEWGWTKFENKSSKFKQFLHKSKISGKIIFAFIILMVLFGMFYKRIIRHYKLRITVIGLIILLLISSIYLLGVHNILLGFGKFYSGQNNSLAANFTVAPIMIISWAVILYQALKRDQSSLILISAALCYLPIIYFMGLSGFRLGQGLIFYYFSYLAIAASVMMVSHRIPGLIGVSDGYMIQDRFFFSVIIAGIIFAQSFLTIQNDVGYVGFLKDRSYFYLKASGHNIRVFVDEKLFGYHAKHLHTWLKKNVPENSVVMISERHRRMYKYRYIGQSHRMIGMRIIESRRSDLADHYLRKGPLILISAIVRKNRENSDFLTVREPDLLKSIRRNNVEYVIVTKRRNFMSLYFDQNEGFKKVKEFGRGGKLKIYKVNDPKPSNDFEPLISTRLIRYLKWLDENQPDSMEDHSEKFFQPLLGWDMATLKDFYTASDEQISDTSQRGGYVLVKNGVVY